MSDYFEIVLDGNTDRLRGFVAGYLAASGLEREVFVSSEFHVESDSLAHQVAEWIGLVKDRTHLVVPEQIHARLEQGAERIGRELGIEIVAIRKLAGASFGFRWKTFSREAADDLRARFGSPPAGIDLQDYSQSEEVREGEEERTGGYAPVHPYQAEGSGVARGLAGRVIGWAAELRQNDLIEVDRIRLEYAD
jgi:hypothetical protein